MYHHLLNWCPSDGRYLPVVSLEHIPGKQGWANFPQKAVVGHRWSPSQRLAVTSNMQTNKHGCVPMKLHLWALKCEFHIIFMGHEISFFFSFFPQTCKNINTVLSLWTAREQDAGHSLGTPVLRTATGCNAWAFDMLMHVTKPPSKTAVSFV